MLDDHTKIVHILPPVKDLDHEINLDQFTYGAPDIMYYPGILLVFQGDSIVGYITYNYYSGLYVFSTSLCSDEYNSDILSDDNLFLLVDELQKSYDNINLKCIYFDDLK